LKILGVDDITRFVKSNKVSKISVLGLCPMAAEETVAGITSAKISSFIHFLHL
jgi:hypothetical protein